MAALDPRINAFRPDLAAKYLEGKVEAARFVEGTLRQVIEPHAPLRRDPHPESKLDTEALYGERFTVFETTDEGWAWGQLHTDGYVGWIPAGALGASGDAPTHLVSARATFGFPSADIKAPPRVTLPLGSIVAVRKSDGRFAQTDAGLFIPAQHLAPITAVASDFVTVAERFLNAPYLWGGKTGDGIDCSGLVQAALQAAGIRCPRDSDMQEKALGKAIPLGEVRRGDLVFWKGHVAIAHNTKALIHANAHHMMVAIEPAEAAIARIATSGSDITSVRRL